MAGVQKSIDVGTLPADLRNLGDLGATKQGIREWLELIRDVMSVLTTHTPHKMEFVNAEHKRKFMALVALGLVEIPYVRTGELEFRGWEIEVVRSGRYRLVNSVAYAQYVHGRNQARYHQVTGHKRLAEVAAYYRPRLGEYITAAGRQPE